MVVRLGTSAEHLDVTRRTAGTDEDWASAGLGTLQRLKLSEFVVEARRGHVADLLSEFAQDLQTFWRQAIDEVELAGMDVRHQHGALRDLVEARGPDLDPTPY